jgi:AraC-like DNA-binding protein
MGNFVLDLLGALAPTMKVVSLPRARHRLHVMPTTAGCDVQTGAHYSWDGRRRGQKPFTVLQHTISGAGWLRFEQQRFRVLPAETLIVTVPHDHCYWVEDGGRWEFFWISMTGQEALRIHRNVLAASGPVLRLSDATIEHLASCCLRIVENASMTPGLASSLAYEALMALHDEFSGEAASMAEQLGPIGRAVDHLRAHAGDRIAVGELAAASGYTRAHFSRKFSRAIGTPPALYARKERLRRAASVLVANPGTTIKQVARLLGFDDPNYFAKAFRRTFGVSPTEYRQKGASTPRAASDADEEPALANQGEARASVRGASFSQGEKVPRRGG